MFWPMLASGGMSLLGGLFGGRKQKTGYELSGEERTLLGQLRAELGTTPGHITAPFVRRRKSIEQDYSRQAGASGLKHAIIKRQADLPMAEAASMHRRGLLSQIAGLVGGRGTRTAETPTVWGDVLGGIGGDIGFLWGLQQMMGGGQKAGGGGGRSGGGMRFQPGFLGRR